MPVAPIDRTYFNTFQKSTLAQCVEMYKTLVPTRPPYFHLYILRSIIGLKIIYSDTAKIIPKKLNIPNAHADKSILALYHSLPLEHCLELYRRQHNNLNDKTRFALRAMIGAKVVYGENYGKPLQSTDSSSES